ncbi:MULTISPECIES: hypothetical protein [Aeromonas]|uniref:hypothetical protein n=1 Tax=Aeromonas TaxID=642 RepID=UPI002B06228C|nr:hypothetical protein [Aeromonas jandaei]
MLTSNQRWIITRTGLVVIMSCIYLSIANMLMYQFTSVVEAEKAAHPAVMSLQQYDTSVRAVMNVADCFSSFSLLGFWVSVALILGGLKKGGALVATSRWKAIVRWAGIAAVMFGHFIWNAALSFNLSYFWKDGALASQVSVREYLAGMDYLIGAMNMGLQATTYSYVVCAPLIILAFLKVR